MLDQGLPVAIRGHVQGMELVLLIVLVLVALALLSNRGGPVVVRRPRRPVVEEIVYEDRPRVVEEVVEEDVSAPPARPRRIVEY